MTKRARRGDRPKKAQRFASLKMRRSKKTLYAALERRQRRENARISAARRRCITTTGHPKKPAIEQRRREYLDIPAWGGHSVLASPLPQRAILVSLVVAFALPLILAIGANLTHRALGVAAKIASHARTNVAGQIHSRPSANGAGAMPAASRLMSRLVRVNSRHHISARIAAAAAPIRPRPEVVPQPAAAAAVATVHPMALPQPAGGQDTARASAAQGSRALPPAAPSTVGANSAVPTPTSQAASAAAGIRQVALAPRSPSPAVNRRRQPLWSLSPDGTWTALIRTPAGMRDATFTASTGQLIALEPSAVEGDAATVTIGWSRPVSVTISSGSNASSVTLPAPGDSPADFAATARAVGPHLINVGWTPLAQTAGVVGYKIYRSAGAGDDPQIVAELAPTKHSWHDLQASPESAYSYDVVAETADGAVDANTQTVQTPDDLPAAPASVLAGKGMFLYFSSLSDDGHNFRHYDPESVIAEARNAGIHVIELRMARGSCTMAQTAESRAWLNNLIDAAAAANISLIAWTVPRRVTTEDVAQTIAAAAYQSPAGNGFSGVALDLETGDHYMGNGRKATASLVQYIKTVRAATGPRYLIVATVASPELGSHTNADYPYAKIAKYADILQPMAYWHYFEETSHHEYARREVADAAAAAVARTRQLAGRDIPVNVAGQSVDLEGTGAPSGREILWSLKAAKSAGGIGETFFDWAGTRPDAWAAIQAFDW